MPTQKNTRDIRLRNGRWPVKFLRSQLAVLKKELSDIPDLKKRVRENLKIETEPIDISEQAVVGADREAEAGLVKMASEKLRLVNGAAVLIHSDLVSSAGSHKYGICVECGKPVSAVRLQAKPFAETCIVCQGAIENREAISGRPFSKVALEEPV